MSKRYYPQQFGDRKKAKLDISLTDHNFPLSQNNEVKDVDFQDTWGDDNDDEILLLASQACEQAYSTNNITSLPDYSICMQPGSTSTQLSPKPSTSMTEFTFKKPSIAPSYTVTSNLKDKCKRISSPLPGITDKILPQTTNELDLNDFKFNDRVYKGQDSDQIYRQFLQLQEENEKLKAENGKLLEKCVTKEGEASILRTQLKSSQIAVDNARLEKIKAQEKVQIEWTEKLQAANTQMQDLRTQLDFKNLEIISIKEKCKKLESTKVKLTQVTIGNNDISQRQNSSFSHNDTSHLRRVKTTSNYVQTDDKAHFVPLNITHIKESPTISPLLPSIVEPSAVEVYSLLDNDKLIRNDSVAKYKIYSSFHRIQASGKSKEVKEAVHLNTLCGDLTSIGNGCKDKPVFFRVFKAIKSILINVENELDSICKKMTTAFQREMDEKYIELTNTYLHVGVDDLLKGSYLYKEEQHIQGRRAVAILSRIVESPTALDIFNLYENSMDNDEESFIECIHRICTLLDGVSCGTLYSGFLLSITTLLQKLAHSRQNQVLDIIKTIIKSRPMPFVMVKLLELVRIVSLWERFGEMFCPTSNLGNLRVDYDQGVSLYNKDSCGLQVLLKQVESFLKCIENQRLSNTAVQTTRQLIYLYSNINCSSFVPDKTKCDCKLVLIQVLVYSLKITGQVIDYCDTEQNDTNQALSVCRCGVEILYQCVLKDVEFTSQLSYYEGHLILFCQIMARRLHSETYANMITELSSTLQSSPEETPPSYHRQTWIKSFQNFSMAD